MPVTIALKMLLAMLIQRNGFLMINAAILCRGWYACYARKCRWDFLIVVVFFCLLRVVATSLPPLFPLKYSFFSLSCYWFTSGDGAASVAGGCPDGRYPWEAVLCRALGPLQDILWAKTGNHNCQLRAGIAQVFSVERDLTRSTIDLISICILSAILASEALFYSWNLDKPRMCDVAVPCRNAGSCHHASRTQRQAGERSGQCGQWSAGGKAIHWHKEVSAARDWRATLHEHERCAEPFF